MSGGSNFGTVRGAGPALDQSLEEQAEPLESDDRIDKPSRPLLQLRPVSSRPGSGLTAVDLPHTEALGGATMLDNLPSRSAILNGLQRRGRSSYSQGSTPVL